jgi:hypothetical protein
MALRAQNRCYIPGKCVQIRLHVLPLAGKPFRKPQKRYFLPLMIIAAAVACIFDEKNVTL